MDEERRFDLKPCRCMSVGTLNTKLQLQEHLLLAYKPCSIEISRMQRRGAWSLARRLLSLPHLPRGRLV